MLKIIPNNPVVIQCVIVLEIFFVKNLKANSESSTEPEKVEKTVRYPKIIFDKLVNRLIIRVFFSFPKEDELKNMYDDANECFHLRESLNTVNKRLSECVMECSNLHETMAYLTESLVSEK